MNQKQSGPGKSQFTVQRTSGDRESGKQSEPGDGGSTRPLTTEAAQLASTVAEQAMKPARRPIEGGIDRAADTLSQIAGALRHSGDEMASNDMVPMVNDYLGRAAAKAEELSDYLKRTSFDRVVGDVETFARREPLLFVGGALLAGLLGGRFLKSSASVGGASGAAS